ncbi:MAG: acetyl-CoA carboxylase, carboxyltransferase subunit beta [Anaeroplasmataceae bacterium]|nr:acetyl-CoA carboxylase, carboxyltransferase subunit beta [Anaeroplasmataceae bacterium]
MQDSFIKRKKELMEFNTALEELNLKRGDTKLTPKQIPDDLMVKCPNCGKFILKEEFILNYKLCPHCNYHARLTASERLQQVMDLGYKELFTDIEEKYTNFPDYKDKLSKAKTDSNSDESIVCVKGRINGISCLVGVMDSFFMMGSMGSVCGERVARLAELALEKHLPLILFTCSGGARMQEGIISLFQMAKTSEAVGRLVEKELFISVLTDPTTGGVSASFASLADITLAEPQALIGFAGKRVIENTIKEKLPKEFQTAEFLLEKGYIDQIVERKELKETLSLLLRLHNYN